MPASTRSSIVAIVAKRVAAEMALPIMTAVVDAPPRAARRVAKRKIIFEPEPTREVRPVPLHFKF